MGKLTAAPQWLIERPIAHRGYHDLSKGRAENSLSAFSAAMDKGFAIECDLQVSGSGEPVVFHDPTLERMTTTQGNVRDLPPQELGKLKLLDTADSICLLRDHLRLVEGTVPIVLELKGVRDEDAGFVEGVAEAVKGYDGPLAVMSFDHWVCAQFAELIPHMPRGLTAHGQRDTYDMHLAAMKEFDLQFVSYHVKDLPTPFIADMRAQGLPVITWTVRDKPTRDLTTKFADQMTFEGFDPSLEFLDE